jgi:hypothetical protein
LLILVQPVATGEASVINGELHEGDLVRVTRVDRPITLRKAALRAGRGRPVELSTEIQQWLGLVIRVGSESAVVRRAVVGDTPAEWTQQHSGDYWSDSVEHFSMMEKIDPTTLVPYVETKPPSPRKGDLVELRVDGEWRSGVVTKTLSRDVSQVLVDGCLTRCLKSRLMIVSRATRTRSGKMTEKEEE